jgi:xylan 1,4-beta-xylosidase
LAGLPVHITEYSTSYRPDNPIHDTAYQAAYLAPILAHGGDLVDSFSLWTFCDVFEEQGVPAAIFHGGFGLLTHRQIPKPAFHLFAFMAQAGPHVLARGADHLVTRHDDGRVVILIWQPVRGSEAGRYGSAPATHEVHLDVPVGDEPDAPVAFIRKSVNEEEGNAWTAWRELGRPASPTSRQLDILREAAVPGLRHGELRTNGSRRVQLDLTLQRHEVSVVELIPVSVEHHPGLDDDRLLGHSR